MRILSAVAGVDKDHVSLSSGTLSIDRDLQLSSWYIIAFPFNQGMGPWWKPTAAAAAPHHAHCLVQIGNDVANWLRTILSLPVLLNPWWCFYLLGFVPLAKFDLLLCSGQSVTPMMKVFIPANWTHQEQWSPKECPLWMDGSDGGRGTKLKATKSDLQNSLSRFGWLNWLLGSGWWSWWQNDDDCDYGGGWVIMIRD